MCDVVVGIVAVAVALGIRIMRVIDRMTRAVVFYAVVICRGSLLIMAIAIMIHHQTVQPELDFGKRS